MSRRAELAAAFGLLTRLPLGRFLPAPDAVDYGASVWAYPVVGVVVGGLVALVYAVSLRIGMTPALGACWALVASVLLTGGLHEDGLADTADGLGGGRSIERRLAIMRDSRIGVFGGLALVLSLAVRGAAIVAIGAPDRVASALIVAGALGRAGMVVVLRVIGPARSDGLAAGLGGVPARAAAAAGGIAGLIGVLFAGVLPGLSLAAVVALAALGWAGVNRRRLGGYTGDTLGAIEVIGECIVLSLIAAG